MPSKDKNARRGQREENYVHRNNVVQNLFIPPRQSDHNGKRSLQRDRERRNARAVEFRQAWKEQTVFGHRKVNSWRGQHALAKKTRSRYGDADGDDATAI